ncbi:DUF3099 domain-containing protein [Nocardia bovistercoris]|uniref:DUF3099 domain-containing protein n=1 Tax=Nocardia bovistercoris TaxID=2785916 RepID=A0A931I758_9NOCA|nr:DUF3099 domain-containing protein [Nocardia bovistercoris]MBH0775123.1 DUF3099 domain-containing protein [Nocardia bovistercoris]
MQQHGESENAGRGAARPESGESAARTRSRGYFPGSDDDHAVLITEAAPSLEEQHRSRVRRYTFIMAFRLPCLVLAAVAYSVWGSALVALLIIGASIPLPWIAVLIANDRPPRRKDEPSRWDGRGDHLAIESKPHNAIDG